MLGFIISFIACGVAIYNIWRNWDQNPVIVTFADRPTPIWQIPFPAITICPEIKAQKEIVDITKVYHMLKGNGSLFYTLKPEE
jgi:acid-sensing ion channel, other